MCGPQHAKNMQQDIHQDINKYGNNCKIYLYRKNNKVQNEEPNRIKPIFGKKKNDFCTRKREPTSKMCTLMYSLFRTWAERATNPKRSFSRKEATGPVTPREGRLGTHPGGLPSFEGTRQQSPPRACGMGCGRESRWVGDMRP